ncbi:dipeptidase [Aurantimicrobium sp. MWH-Uga1]|uniref:dipeptidase n=1 Tax=Aurantimicrobium sp. MWH-Uga1 TaxID=2079575 RepID=UPI000DED9DF8|nr:dipeptidase [Aurantimicrobium sp. MWH-Uga1]AXE54497.1 Succinyl-diaminopimelate desuccinylase [Aurantimicrobium sp. MWH-Uga1]
MTDSLPDVELKVSSYFSEVIDTLTELVAIPSVSWPAFDQTEVERSAEKIVSLVNELNFFDSVELLNAPIGQTQKLGQPAVVARREASPGYPTILLYAHHDVQPPGDISLWETPPFVATQKDGRLFGRGCADDKAGILVHLTSIRILKEIEHTPNIGVVLFIEGEEEYGSPSFENFLSLYRAKLESEVIVVADSGNWDTSTPALTTTLRGNVTFKLSLRTLDHALHSGMFGGVVPDSFTVFSQLVSSFFDKSGSVVISGLEKTQTSALSYSEERIREESGVLPEVDLIGSGDILSRLWTQPSVTITGVDFPSIENASNTLVPEISARISLRVAPGQQAQDAFDAFSGHAEEFLKSKAIFSITDVSTGEGFVADIQGWAAKSMQRCLSEAFGNECVEMGVGGSIPFISSFVDVFPGAQVLVTGVEDPDSCAHSPNESLDLDSLQKAIVAQTLFLLRCNQKSI